jgi:predicted nucleic acid-binding protein
MRRCGYTLRFEIDKDLMVKPVYPDEMLLRTALRGAVAYQLSWFDAHLWAYAEHFGLSELLSEDFQHDRLYGSVRAVNPFLRRSFAGRFPSKHTLAGQTASFANPPPYR